MPIRPILRVAASEFTTGDRRRNAFMCPIGSDVIDGDFFDINLHGCLYFSALGYLSTVVSPSILSSCKGRNAMRCHEISLHLEPSYKQFLPISDWISSQKWNRKQNMFVYWCILVYCSLFITRVWFPHKTISCVAGCLLLLIRRFSIGSTSGFASRKLYYQIWSGDELTCD